MAKRTSRNIEAKETLDLMRAQITKLDEQIEKADTLAEKGKKRSAAEEVTYQNIKKQNAELKRKIKNTATNETQIENLGKKFANLSKSQQKILQNTVNWTDNMATLQGITLKESESLQKIRDLSSETMDLGLAMVHNRKNLNSEEFETVDLSSHLSDLMKTRKSLADGEYDITEQGVENNIKLINAQIKNVKSMQAQSKMHDLINKKNTELNSKIEAQKEKWGDIKAKLISIVTNPITALKVGILAIGVGLVALGKKMVDFGNETGFSYGQLIQFGPAILFAREEAKALLAEFGSLDIATSQNLMKMKLLGFQYGVSAESTAKLAEMMMAVSGSSFSASMHSLAMVGELARANKVAPAAVMEDLAGDTEMFATYAKDGGDNLFTAAIEARKLGLSIATTAKMAESLLDFESSIESSMEASILLGRNINTDKARQLAFTGDLAGMQREVLKQVGSQAELENMQYFQRKKLAAAFGVGVEELTKMVLNQEHLNHMSTDQTAAAEKHAAMVKNIGTAWNDITGALKKRFQPMLESIGEKIPAILETMSGWITDYIAPALEWMVKNWKIIAITVGVLLLPVIAIAAKFALMVASVGLLVTGIKKLYEYSPGLLASLTALAAVALLFRKRIIGNGMLTKLGKMKGLISGMASSKGGLSTDKAGRLRDAKGRFAKAPKPKGKAGLGFVERINPKKMLAGAAAMVIVAGALYITAQALVVFNKVDWPSLGKAALALGGLVVAVLALGAIMSSGVGTVAILAGAAAMVIMAGGLLVLGYAIQAIGTGFTMLSAGFLSFEPILTKLAPMTSSIISLGEAFGKLGWGMAKLAGGALLLSPFLPVLDKLTGIGGSSDVTVSGDGNTVNQATDMAETNKLLTQIVGVNRELLKQNKDLMNKLTGKVGELGVSD